MTLVVQIIHHWAMFNSLVRRSGGRGELHERDFVRRRRILEHRNWVDALAGAVKERRTSSPVSDGCTFSVPVLECGVFV